MFESSKVVVLFKRFVSLHNIHELEFHVLSTVALCLKIILTYQRSEKSKIPHFLDNRLTNGDEVRLTHRPLFTPAGRFLVLISLRGRVNPRPIVRVEEFN
jgi:hypothetical protein